MAKHQTYQLLIVLALPQRLVIGRLGSFLFPAGTYVYTGSARRNLEARIARHRRREKPLHWHVDYLLASPHASVVDVRRSDKMECLWNQSGGGTVVAPGFGASDCKSGCGSHLRYHGYTGG